MPQKRVCLAGTIYCKDIRHIRKEDSKILHVIVRFLHQPICIESYENQELILSLWCTATARVVLLGQDGSIFAYSYKSRSMHGEHLALYILLRPRCSSITPRRGVLRIILATGSSMQLVRSSGGRIHRLYYKELTLFRKRAALKIYPQCFLHLYWYIVRF